LPIPTFERPSPAQEEVQKAEANSEEDLPYDEAEEIEEENYREENVKAPYVEADAEDEPPFPQAVSPTQALAMKVGLRNESPPAPQGTEVKETIVQATAAEPEPDEAPEWVDDDGDDDWLPDEVASEADLGAPAEDPSTVLNLEEEAAPESDQRDSAEPLPIEEEIPASVVAQDPVVAPVPDIESQPIQVEAESGDDALEDTQDNPEEESNVAERVENVLAEILGELNDDAQTEVQNGDASSVEKVEAVESDDLGQSEQDEERPDSDVIEARLAELLQDPIDGPPVPEESIEQQDATEVSDDASESDDNPAQERPQSLEQDEVLPWKRASKASSMDDLKAALRPKPTEMENDPVPPPMPDGMEENPVPPPMPATETRPESENTETVVQSAPLFPRPTDYGETPGRKSPLGLWVEDAAETATADTAPRAEVDDASGPKAEDTLPKPDGDSEPMQSSNDIDVAPVPELEAQPKKDTAATERPMAAKAKQQMFGGLPPWLMTEPSAPKASPTKVEPVTSTPSTHGPISDEPPKIDEPVSVAPEREDQKSVEPPLALLVEPEPKVKVDSAEASPHEDVAKPVGLADLWAPEETPDEAPDDEPEVPPGRTPLTPEKIKRKRKSGWAFVIPKTDHKPNPDPDNFSS
jgi:hypothetical protein